MSTLLIDASVIWTYCEVPGSHRVVAVCDDLNIVQELDRLSELLPEIQQSMNVFVRYLIRHEELKRFLQSKGWSARGNFSPRSAVVFTNLIVKQNVNMGK